MAVLSSETVWPLASVCAEFEVNLNIRNSTLLLISVDFLNMIRVDRFQKYIRIRLIEN